VSGRQGGCWKTRSRHIVIRCGQTRSEIQDDRSCNEKGEGSRSKIDQIRYRLLRRILKQEIAMLGLRILETFTIPMALNHSLQNPGNFIRIFIRFEVWLRSRFLRLQVSKFPASGMASYLAGPQ